VRTLRTQIQQGCMKSQEDSFLTGWDTRHTKVGICLRMPYSFTDPACPVGGVRRAKQAGSKQALREE